MWAFKRKREFWEPCICHDQLDICLRRLGGMLTDVNFSDGKRKYVSILKICVTQGTNSFQRTNSRCKKSLLCLIKEDIEMASQHRERALCHMVSENCELKCEAPLHTVRLWKPKILMPPRADGPGEQGELLVIAVGMQMVQPLWRMAALDFIYLDAWVLMLFNNLASRNLSLRMSLLNLVLLTSVLYTCFPSCLAEGLPNHMATYSANLFYQEDTYSSSSNYEIQGLVFMEHKSQLYFSRRKMYLLLSIQGLYAYYEDK